MADHVYFRCRCENVDIAKPDREHCPDCGRALRSRLPGRGARVYRAIDYDALLEERDRPLFASRASMRAYFED